MGLARWSMRTSRMRSSRLASACLMSLASVPCSADCCESSTRCVLVKITQSDEVSVAAAPPTKSEPKTPSQLWARVRARVRARVQARVRLGSGKGLGEG